MKTFDFIKRVALNPLIAAGVITCAMIGALAFLGSEAGLKTDEWASWVQAVGSISAILISIGLAGHQIDRQKTIETARIATNDARIATFAKHVVMNAINAVKVVKRSQDRWPQETNYEFLDQPRIEAAIATIQTVMGEPLPSDLISPVMTAHSMLVEVRSTAGQLKRAGAYLTNSRYAMVWRQRENEITQITQQIELATAKALADAEEANWIARHF